MAKTKEQNPVTGFRIDTPDDFCSTLGAHSHSVAIWIKLRGERERLLRRTLNDIFKDLPYVDSLDSDSVTDFLDGIESPLESLNRMGFQLFAVSVRGSKAVPQVVQKVGKQLKEWRHNSYIVAPDPAYFWLEPSGRTRTVHTLSGACREGLRELVLHPERTVHVHHAVENLSGAFEGEIPWCPVCFLQHAKQEIA